MHRPDDSPLTGSSGRCDVSWRRSHAPPPQPPKRRQHLVSEVLHTPGNLPPTQQPVALPHEDPAHRRHVQIDAQRFVDVANGGDSTQLDAELIAGAQALGAGRPSLLQDVIRGRRVEIDALNGWVVERGQDVEVPTPANAAITEVVRSFPVGTLRPDPANLQPVLARLDID